MNNLNNETEIALFPIPGNVAFPFSVTSLHVFEPRYRKMIKDSITDRRRIGVAHTQKMLSNEKFSSTDSIETILNSNHENYLAHSIFSAGFAEIKETLADGRLLVEIHMDSRYQIKNEIQQVPYKIVACEPFIDEVEESDNLSRDNLNQILVDFAAKNGADLLPFIQSADWKNLSLNEYSFKIYTIVNFEPHVLQNILELKSPQKRIQFLVDILTRGPLQ